MAGHLETVPSSLAALKSALLEAIRPHCPPERAGEGAPEGGGERRTGAGALSRGQWERIGREIMSLHEGYTAKRAQFSQAENPIHSFLAGYQFYYLPRNLHRVSTVLRSLPWQEGGGGDPVAPLCHQRGKKRTLRLLDLGCGSGAFSLAWLVWLSERFPSGRGAPALRITLVDQGRQLLTLAAANLRGFAARALPEMALQIEPRADGVARFLAREEKSPPYGVVGAAMMLNELGLLGPRRVNSRAVRYSEALLRLARGGGCLMLVEPGTRKGYMNLMTLRERMEDLPILYPCPHNLPCPFWSKRVRNWCHADLPLPGGFFFDDALREFGQVDFNMREITMAALAVQVSAGGEVQPPFAPQKGGRVVSDPMPSRKKPSRKKKSARSEAARPEEAAEERMVLVCQHDGKLHERPVRPNRPLPPGKIGGVGRRGSWLEGGSH